MKNFTLSLHESPQTLPAAFRVFWRFWSPRILLATFVSAVAIRLSLAQWSWWDLAIVAALFIGWPLLEWLIHVYLLHFKPFMLGKWKIDPLVPRKHREHHQDPYKLELLFIPIHSYLLSLPTIIIAACYLLPTLPLAWTWLAAFFGFSLHYEWTHYYVHTRCKIKNRYYRHLWQSHRLHHFKNEHYWWGVSRIEADTWLDTTPEINSVPTSSTCFTLGQDNNLEAIH